MKFKMLINIEIAKIDGIFLFKSLKPVIYPANKCENAIKITFMSRMNLKLS